MQFKTHIPDTLDEVAVEIASILAKGYMRHQTGRRLPSDSMIRKIKRRNSKNLRRLQRKNLIFRATETFMHS